MGNIQSLAMGAVASVFSNLAQDSEYYRIVDTPQATYQSPSLTKPNCVRNHPFNEHEVQDSQPFSNNSLGYNYCTPEGVRARTTSGDVVRTYTEILTARVHEIANAVRSFVPAKADEIMSKVEQQELQLYIKRFVDMLLLEVDEEVKEFVAQLKDWPLAWLVESGRVLLDLSGAAAGEYYGQQLVRFSATPAGPSSGTGTRPSAARRGFGSDEEALPRHSLAPGDMVLLTPAKHGPMKEGSWYEGTMYGVVTERARNWIKVAFQAGPTWQELQYNCTWRLDQSVNTLTTERALLALVALWHRLPFSTDIWSWKSLITGLFGAETSTSSVSYLPKLTEFYEMVGNMCQQRMHTNVFEGCSLSDIIVRADKSFYWSSLPAEAGGIPPTAVKAARQALPEAGRPNEAATAALLRELEQQGRLASRAKLKLDSSQMCAIATAIVNPLTLLHGPPGTGKTTTIGGLLFMLRRKWGYKGSILATAQSNVAVDNMLETALKRGLKVLRIGEPVKVRSCLQRFTLRAALEEAIQRNPAIKAARDEQRQLRQTLRLVKIGRLTVDRHQRRMIYERLDALTAKIKAETARVTRQLLAAADVVGVTCTGAAGPELADVAFDMVIIDEGSQASEPEALIPLMKGCRRAVLVGDHKQLPPVIKSKAAADAGLNVSLFERLMYLGAPSAMLQVQYRAHPELMSFVNKQFYHGLLSNGVTAEQRPAPPGFKVHFSSSPLVFIAVDGKENSNARGSKLNKKEADVIERLVVLLVQRCGLRPGDLGIISPYVAQVSLLSRKLSERGYSINSKGGQGVDDLGANDLEVKSVDGYQGREKEVILLSTVRANMQQQVGFLDDWRRANVALSRARRALVVVGHRGTLRGSDTWGAFLDHAAEKGCLVKHEHLSELH